MRDESTDWRLAAFVACWTAPMAAFYVFIHVGDPGYVFTILPALLLLAARQLTMIPRSVGARSPRPGAEARSTIAAISLTALILIGNVGLALFYPRQLTLVGIGESDAAIRQKIEYLKSNGAAESTLLVSYETYRHLQYYLPGFKAAWIDTFDPREQVAGIPAGVTQVVLVDRGIQNAGWQEKARPVAAGMLIVPIGGEQQVVYAQGTLKLK